MQMRKLNQKEEAACLAFERGLSQADAYREAYPTSLKWNAGTVATKSCLLFSRPHIIARVAEGRAKSAARNSITVDTLLAELEENRQAALGAETPQASAATAATMGKAKLLGLDKQIVEHHGKDGGAIITRVERVIIDAPED